MFDNTSTDIEKKINITIQIDAKTEIEAKVIEQNLQKFYNHFGDSRFASLIANFDKIMKKQIFGINVGDKLLETIDSFIRTKKNAKK